MNPMAFMILAAEKELENQRSMQRQYNDTSSASQFTFLQKIYNKVTNHSRSSYTINASEANCCSTVKVSSKA
jgi:hypothetical protein